MLRAIVRSVSVQQALEVKDEEDRELISLFGVRQDADREDRSVRNRRPSQEGSAPVL